MGMSSKTYRAEAEVWGVERHSTLYEAKQLIDECLRHLPDIGRPKVVFDSGFALDSGLSRGDMIVFAAHITTSLVLHEMAHFSALRLYGPGCKHGREWVEMYVHLTRATVSGDIADELALALNFARSKVNA